MNRTETLPTTDLDRLLDRERTLAGLPARIDLSQIVGLWRLNDSYLYDPDRETWENMVSLASHRVRVRFHADGTAEEYEAELTVGRYPYHLDPQRGILTWENCEHYIVSLTSSRMELVVQEPVARVCEAAAVLKFVYERTEE